MVFRPQQGACMRRKAKQIFQDVKSEIQKHNIDLKLTKNYKLICESEKCYGYFIPPEKKKKGELAIATGEKRHVDYLWDLAHELAHFRQWKRDDPTYLKHMSDNCLYSVLEQKTEKEAKKIFSSWGFRISNRLRKRSEKYLKTLKE
jgi:predicted transcriptional regulator